MTTYGDIARALGSVRVARHVGFALAALPDEADDVPWYRVVNGRGRIHRPAESSEGAEQRRLLAAEGIDVDDEGRVQRFRAMRFTFEIDGSEHDTFEGDDAAPSD